VGLIAIPCRALSGLVGGGMLTQGFAGNARSAGIAGSTLGFYFWPFQGQFDGFTLPTPDEVVPPRSR